ncbi:MAG: hypothetical protein IT165_06415 [Bryobacterales bacterium]|nr:hypothetical protein [Bryobacterales bacterium]
MSYTPEQIAAMKNALASGVLRVRFADREMEYRSFKEMQAIIDAAEAEIAEQNGTPPNRQIHVSTSKGL